MPKKMKQLARKSILSYKANKGEIFIVDEFIQIEPKTARFYEFLESMDIQKQKILVLPEEVGKNIRLSVRNIYNVDIKKAGSASTYDLINHDILLFDKPGLLSLNENLSN